MFIFILFSGPHCLLLKHGILTRTRPHYLNLPGSQIRIIFFPLQVKIVHIYVCCFVFACDYIRPMVTQCVLPKDKQNQSSLSERSDSHFHLQPRHTQHLKIWAHIFFSTLRGAVLAVALALILFSCNFPTKSVTARPSLCKPTAPKQLVGVFAGNCARL